MNIDELFTRGGVVVWILAAYSIVGIAIVLDRYLLFLRQHKLPKEIQAGLNRLLDNTDTTSRISNLKGPEARIIQAVVDANQQGVKDLHGVGTRIRSAEMQRMETGLPTLGLLGNTAPLLGLLGTITGMIKAFMVIEQAGGKVDAQALAGGIWEAMITTGVGLAVAIPLLILLHLLEGGVERRVQSMESCLSLLLERRPGTHTPTEQAEASHHWEEITDGV
ncbi:MAG: MotA/TolQ/ExbB proton channel family protein [Gammaproteobacteria bacterium]|nr:MotA/TolQ/ExbB proton channel family protein [Gammaproteobacteria bacterium]